MQLISKKRRMSAHMRGFTLIEIMIVVVIISFLAALIAPQLIGQLDFAKRAKATADIQMLGTLLDLYNLQKGAFPTTDEGLDKLVEAGLLKQPKIPKDPWKNAYVYISPGVNSPYYDIVSYGADGAEGGAGKDADVQSWNLEGVDAPPPEDK